MNWTVIISAYLQGIAIGLMLGLWIVIHLNVNTVNVSYKDEQIIVYEYKGDSWKVPNLEGYKESFMRTKKL